MEVFSYGSHGIMQIFHYLPRSPKDAENMLKYLETCSQYTVQDEIPVTLFNSYEITHKVDLTAYLL